MLATNILLALTALLATATATNLERRYDACGDGTVACGNTGACYSPSKGEVCCSNNMVYPAGSQCPDANGDDCTTTPGSDSTLSITSTQCNTVTVTVTSNETTTITLSLSNVGGGNGPNPPASTTPCETSAIPAPPGSSSTTEHPPSMTPAISSGIIPPYIQSSIASANSASSAEAHSTPLGYGTSTASASPGPTTHITTVAAASHTSTTSISGGFTGDGTKNTIKGLSLIFAIQMVLLSAFGLD